MTDEQQKIIHEQQAIIDEMHSAFSQIGDFADGLNHLIRPLLDGMTETTIIDLTFKKIIEICDAHI